MSSHQTNQPLLPNAKRARRTISPNGVDQDLYQQKFLKLVEESNHPKHIKKLLTTDLSDPISIWTNYASQSKGVGDSHPPPSYIAKFDSLEGMAKGLNEWFRLTPSAQDEIWTEYSKCTELLKYEWKRKVLHLETQIVDTINKLYRDSSFIPIQDEIAQEGSNISIVPEHGSSQDIRNRMPWVGQFQSNAVRNDAVETLKRVIADSKIRNPEKLQPATHDHLQKHKSALNRVVSEIEYSSSRTIDQGRMNQSMYIHFQSIDYNSKGGSKAAQFS